MKPRSKITISNPIILDGDKVPILDSQNHVKDPLCLIKFFTNTFEWYIIEYDGKDKCFGLEVVQFKNIGDNDSMLCWFNLSSIKKLNPKRDIEFRPTTLSQIQLELLKQKNQ